MKFDLSFKSVYEISHCIFQTLGEIGRNYGVDTDETAILEGIRKKVMWLELRSRRQEWKNKIVSSVLTVLSAIKGVLKDSPLIGDARNYLYYNFVK